MRNFVSMFHFDNKGPNEEVFSFGDIIKSAVFNIRKYGSS